MSSWESRALTSERLSDWEHDGQGLHHAVADAEAVVETLRHDMPELDRVATIPNAVTASRPYIAARKIAPKLVRGEVGVTPWMGALMATDAEGSVARIIDRVWPDSGFGSSSLGAKIDPPADTLSMLTVATAALRSERIPRRGKIAVGAVLATEAHKTIWAMRSNYRHILETGEQLSFRPSFLGKTATANKLAALTLAVCSHDIEEQEGRRKVAGAALVLAIGGAATGELALRRYDQRYNS